MSFSTLSSRAIIGSFYRQLEQDTGESWINRTSMLFSSNQESETYAWLGQVPTLREWIGGRLTKPIREDGITITNKVFEATLEIPVDWMMRDKTGQIQVRIGELATRANSHWADLLSTLIIAGESATCYDGQYFFDTDHSEGDSGSQSNDISVDITTTTAPTASEMQTAILTATQTLLGFKDDQGQPCNTAARQFTVMVPVPFLSAAAAALGSSIISTSDSNIKAVASLGGFGYELAINPRLTWTTKLALFRSDGQLKPLIRQEEQGVQIAAVAEGSELAFNERIHRYGVSAKRNVGYGDWKHACLVTFT